MKIYLYFLIILFCSPLAVIAAETDKPSNWGGDTSVFSSGFNGQEAVTDNKLNKTIKMLKERNLTNKQKKMKMQVQPLSPQSDFDHLKNFAQSTTEDDELSQTHTVMIPTVAYNSDGQSIQAGYYKLSCRKLAENEYVLDLTQGSKKVLSVNAKQTVQDLEQESISFCNAEIIDSNRIRLLYGTIDLNLVGYLYFK